MSSHSISLSLDANLLPLNRETVSFIYFRLTDDLHSKVYIGISIFLSYSYNASKLAMVYIQIAATVRLTLFDNQNLKIYWRYSFLFIIPQWILYYLITLFKCFQFHNDYIYFLYTLVSGLPTLCWYVFQFFLKLCSFYLYCHLIWINKPIRIRKSHYLTL